MHNPRIPRAYRITAPRRTNTTQKDSSGRRRSPCPCSPA